MAAETLLPLAVEGNRRTPSRASILATALPTAERERWSRVAAENPKTMGAWTRDTMGRDRLRLDEAPIPDPGWSSKQTWACR